MFWLLAASVVTLHCETYDITSGSREGSPVRFTATVDYGRSFAYLKGAPVFADPVGIGDVGVTPGEISVPRAVIGDVRTLRGLRISRTSGEVRLLTHDMRRAIDDALADNDRDGEQILAGVCRPGALVPIPAARF